jgi:hypothetical protein
MKRVILILAIFILIVSVQAQRRYPHFQRVKVDKYYTEEEKIVQEGERVTVGTVEVAQNEPVQIKEVITYQYIKLNLKVKKNQRVKKNPDENRINFFNVNSDELIHTVLKEHKKLDNVKEVKKTNLRTWKWLIISFGLLLIIGILVIILAYTYIITVGWAILGIIIGALGVIGMLISLILGLSGRI